MMPRIFLEQAITVGQRLRIQGPDGHHFARVLRVQPSEPVAIAANGGAVFLAKVESVDARTGEVEVLIAQTLPSHESRRPVYLVQGLAKGDKIETIIQKCTEVGVVGIVVVETQRSVVRLDAKKADGKLARWRKVAQEAASQSQRDILPVVSYLGGVQALKRWLEETRPALIVFLDESDTVVGGLRSVLRQQAWESDLQKPIVIAVGPEGGWDDVERRLWTEEFKAVRVTLGPRILRTETAGLVAAAAVLFELGELGG